MSLKWIKASERLPEKWGMYYVKIGPLEDKTCWTRGKIIERFNEGLDKIEWLSEDSKEDEREDCVASVQSPDSDSVVSLPCTSGNSIELNNPFEDKEILDFLRGRDKPFFMDTFRKLLFAFLGEEISMSKFVEELNIAAYKWRKNALNTQS